MQRGIEALNEQHRRIIQVAIAAVNPAMDRPRLSWDECEIIVVPVHGQHVARLKGARVSRQEP